MTTYITITDIETDPDAPLTSELAKKWRDNAIAIGEGDLTAPVNAACWHPYDMVFANDGAIGRFYNGATQATITTPTFEDGWDYMIRWLSLSQNTASRDIDLDIGGLNIILEASSVASDVISGTLQVDMPTLENSVRYVTYTRRNAAAGITLTSTHIPTTFASAITSATFSLSGTGSFDAGQVFLYRRRNYISG